MKWLEIGMKLAPLVVAAVNGVERIVKNASGKEKQDAAVDLVGSMLEAIEGLASKDLLNDVQVQLALRNAIDAVVALQNTIAAVKLLKPVA